MIFQRLKNLWELSSWEIPDRIKEKTNLTQSNFLEILRPSKKLATIVDYSEPLEEFPKDETKYDYSD